MSTFTTRADELEQVRTKDIELVTCVNSQVRVKISHTRAKTCDVLLQFPADYPDSLILMEVKSKTLPQRLTDNAVRVFDAEPGKVVNGGGQIMTAIRFVIEFLKSNPLCVCVEEISEAKKLLDLGENSKDFFKVKQSKSQVHICVESADYRLEARVSIPENYPDERVTVQFDQNTNFPDIFATYFKANSSEISRKCIHPPQTSDRLRAKQKTPTAAWHPQPSLFPVLQFLIVNAKRYPTDTCGLCNKRCFPATPPSTSHFASKAAAPLAKTYPNGRHKIVRASKDDFFDIERIYCGHIYHFDCLDKYMKRPPFTGGKKCAKCPSIIYHEKWRETEQVREERWAAFQAKERELEEVADFLK